MPFALARKTPSSAHNLSLSNVAVVSFTVVGDSDQKAEARAMAGLKNHFDKARATYARVTGTMRGGFEAAASGAMETRAGSFVRSHSRSSAR